MQRAKSLSSLIVTSDLGDRPYVPGERTLDYWKWNDDYKIYVEERNRIKSLMTDIIASMIAKAEFYVPGNVEAQTSVTGSNSDHSIVPKKP